MSKLLSRTAALLAISLFAPLPTIAQTSVKPEVVKAQSDPKSFLFVGNSFFYYNNSMHSQLLAMIRAADQENAQKYRATSATISGSGMNWHNVDAYLDPKSGMASYSFVGDNEVQFNKLDKPFDAVIMQDCSQCPVHPQLSGLFHEYSKKHSDTVRARGAEPVLFMTWAYQDKPEMTQQLADQYTKAGNDNDALVIPAGLAFANAISKKPDIVLYEKDKRHPSKLGTYLGAATAYAALTGKSPVGNPATAGIDPETAKFLQSVAWDTVQQYYSS